MRKLIWASNTLGGLDCGGRVHRVEWTLHGHAGYFEKSKTRGFCVNPHLNYGFHRSDD